MLIVKEPVNKTVTVSSGIWSGNTQKVMGILLQVIVSAATETTTFDFSITDDDGITIRSWTGNTDELNEEVYIPLAGIYTLAIANSSADEVFTVYLGIDES